MAQFRPVQPSTANYRPVQPSAAQYSQVQPSTTLQYGRGGRSDHEQPLYTISTTISTTITAVTQAPNHFVNLTNLLTRPPWPPWLLWTCYDTYPWDTYPGTPSNDFDFKPCLSPSFIHHYLLTLPLFPDCPPDWILSKAYLWYLYWTFNDKKQICTTYNFTTYNFTNLPWVWSHFIDIYIYNYKCTRKARYDFLASHS